MDKVICANGMANGLRLLNGRCYMPKGTLLPKGADLRARGKIQTTQLVKRLTDHVNGTVELTASQVTAALGLIKKTLPDLQNVDATMTMDQTVRVISSEPMNASEWEAKYGSGVAASNGASESTH